MPFHIFVKYLENQFLWRLFQYDRITHHKSHPTLRTAMLGLDTALIGWIH